MATVLQFDQLAPMLRAIPSLPRPVLARLTERMIERLDQLDGDPDIEPNGDELDGTGGEDDFIDRSGMQGGWHGAGCPISDPPEDADIDRCMAGDDGVFAGCGVGYPIRSDTDMIGSEDDLEMTIQPSELH